jgi:hypothetical protein
MNKYQNKKWLLKRYRIDKLSISEIAKECNADFRTITRWLDRFMIRKIKSRGINRRGHKAGYWRGGRYKDNTSGYVWLHNPDHPFCTKKGYVLEHRLAIEKFIGRHLRGNEIIHHKNKKKDDNRIENLEIIVLGEPNCGKIRCPFCNRGFKAG